MNGSRCTSSCTKPLAAAPAQSSAGDGQGSCPTFRAVSDAEQPNGSSTTNYAFYDRATASTLIPAAGYRKRARHESRRRAPRGRIRTVGRLPIQGRDALRQSRAATILRIINLFVSQRPLAR